MATITGLTAARMLIIEAASVVAGKIVGDNLILTKRDGSEIVAGNVRGPKGDTGATSPPSGAAGGDLSGAYPNPTIATSAKQQITPPGAIMAYAGSAAPTGYLLCEGQAVSRTNFTALFAALGTTYGAGDGSKTFNLPNMKGRVAVCLDTTITDFDTRGKTAGEKTRTMSLEEMPQHSHAVGLGDVDGTLSVRLVQGGDTKPKSGWRMEPDGLDGGFRYFTTDKQGSGTAYNNMPPYIVLRYIIKI